MKKVYKHSRKQFMNFIEGQDLSAKGVKGIIRSYLLAPKEQGEHSEDKLNMFYIKLNETEKKILCKKGSLVGTDAREPEVKLCDYVEKLINQYASLTLIAHGPGNYHIGESNEMTPIPKKAKRIEKVEDECRDTTTWVRQLWKKQCELIDVVNSLLEK